MKELDENGSTIYEEQSFWVNLKNWGKVKFVSGFHLENSRRTLKFYLVDKNQIILYQFSDFETGWHIFEIRDISINDVNNDGLEDLVFIAEYATGVGPTAAALFPLAGVYFQKDKEFIRDRKLDDEIESLESVDMVLEYIKERDIKIDLTPTFLGETPYSGTVEAFILSIKNNDAESLKQMISPSGLIVIRNFCSGFGKRGKDIRGLYAMDEIPDNLQFEVIDESPVTLHDLFTESQQCEVSDIPVTQIDDRYFSFTDDIETHETHNYAPPTEEVINLCCELGSNYSPWVFELGDKEVVLTESSLFSMIGKWAVFEKQNNEYFLRAIINLK